MTLPELILWGVVLVVGVPSAWRNPTAAALVLCFIAAKAIYLITGDSLAVEYYLFPDIMVIAVIMSKLEHCNLAPYRSTLHQLSCLLLERSPADRVVLLIFPICWAIYVADISAFSKWYALWGLSLAQFLAAGVEALLSYHRDADAVASPPDQGSLLVAHIGGRVG